MDIKDRIKKTDVLILCGGFGTRLQTVLPNKQKVLASFNGKVFLDFIIEELLKFGFQRFIFCVGHLKEQVKQHALKYSYLDINYSEEEVSKGTGGAIKYAQPLIKSNPFLVLNGDSFCKVNYFDLFNFHLLKESITTLSLSHPKGRRDGGNVVISKNQKIERFVEKDQFTKNALISAGIYLMNQEIFKLMPDKEQFSLEYEVLPKLAELNSFGFLAEGDVMDIGTVDRYLWALKNLQ